MNDEENKILYLLESGYNIDRIIKELNIEEESLADKIIELEGKELIVLEDKDWTLTQKGKDTLQEMKELLRKIKIEYLYGNINKDEFQKKRKELESFIMIEKPREDEKIYKEKKIVCPKCGKENKIDSKFCFKCGETLKK
jgi:predicted transcriptional regulator